LAELPTPKDFANEVNTIGENVELKENDGQA
jgi:hypothetical protein